MSDLPELLLIGLAIVVVFPVALIGMFALVTTLLAALGGWSRLAERYRADPPADGWTWTMQSGRMGVVNYRNILSVARSAGGLHLGVFALFRVRHPALFLPWSSMHDARPRKIFWWDLIEVTVDAARPVRMALPAKVFPPGFLAR